MNISAASRAQFMTLLTPKQYLRDEIILNEGTINRYIYLVEKGLIRQFYYKDGRDITEHFTCEGEIATCLESLFLQKPTRLMVQAIEPTDLYLLDYEKWKQLCDVNPEINKLYRAIMEYKLVVSQQKADSWRFENSRERYDRFCKDFPSAARRAAIAHIASYLLMTPETLSRVRAGVL